MNKNMKKFSDTIIERLEEDQSKMPWVKPWKNIDQVYRNCFSGRPYTGLYNVILCAIDEHEDPRYATFNQIAKQGGKVKKGAKGTPLVAWNIVHKKDEETGKKKTIPFMKLWNLFNVEDVEGVDFPEINILNEENEENKDIIELYEELGVKYTHEKSNSAHYVSRTDSINLPHISQYDEDNLDAWSGTCIHELIHWTADKVGHNVENYHFDIESRALEELVAELGSMYLCMRMNINGWSDSQNLAYINSWIKASKSKNGEKLIYKASKLAEERCNFILREGKYEKKEKKELAEVI
jgi:antirestriction protein ArdC